MKQQPIFSRLMGLETEYAIRFRSSSGVQQVTLYRALLSALRQRLPLVSGSSLEEKHFTANGGTIGFERVSHSGGFGLIECATPECRGPRELITWQRAQDRLVMQCAQDCNDEANFFLVKNSRDSQGNVYGSHENYAIRVGPIAIWFWRFFALVASVMSIGFWLLVIPAMIAFALCYMLVAGIAYLFIASIADQNAKQALKTKLFGDGFAGDEDACPFPQWMETTINRLTMGLCLPGLLLISFAGKFFVYGKTARKLTPFLVTRPILSGSGWLDSDGKFWLAQKAPAIRSIIGPLMSEDYPLFSVAHLFDTCLVGFSTLLNYLPFWVAIIACKFA